MPDIMFWFVYFIFVAITFVAIRNINVSRLDFIDGVLVGLVFFIVVPLFFIIWDGRLYEAEILAPPYVPTQDTATTINIFVGWASILLIHFLKRTRKSRATQPVSEYPPRNLAFVLKVIIGLYFVFQTYTFITSGMGDAGGHWHASLADAFETSTSFIIVRNFTNSFRTMVFGALIVCQIGGIIRARTAIALGAAVCLFDLFTSFNRITMVYMFFMTFIILRRHWVMVIAGTIAIVPPLMTASSLWPMFRGLALEGGFNLHSMSRALDASLRNAGDSSESLSSSMNSIFESSNIVVLNYVVQHSGETVPVFWGWTYILRPLTTFIPSTFWPDKPRVFGTYLGEIINFVPGLALNSTLFGEVIANFPFIWPVIFILTIGLFTKLYAWVDRHVPGANFMAFFVAIALWRFDMNFASTSLYALAFVFIVIKLIRFIGSASRSGLRAQPVVRQKDGVHG